MIVEMKINNNTLLIFKDKLLDKYNLNSFERELNNKKYIFNEGNIVYKEKVLKLPYLKPIQKSIYKNNNILTMDLETRLINNIMTPYSLSIFDGKEIKNYYLTDYKESKEMLKAGIISIMKRKYNGYKVYLHNFSNFDAIFLIKILSLLNDNIKPIIRDNKILDIKYKFANKYTLYFRDSYLLLPLSLENLCLNFNVEKKGIFPYQFVNNENISLNYEGNIPDIKYFNNLSKVNYDKYCNSFENNI
jgi:hypothetical protein